MGRHGDAQPAPDGEAQTINPVVMDAGAHGVVGGGAVFGVVVVVGEKLLRQAPHVSTPSVVA